MITIKQSLLMIPTAIVYVVIMACFIPYALAKAAFDYVEENW